MQIQILQTQIKPINQPIPTSSTSRHDTRNATNQSEKKKARKRAALLCPKDQYGTGTLHHE